MDKPGGFTLARQIYIIGGMSMAISMLNVDTGIQEYQINNGGILRFNPSDPNLYSRFFESIDEIDTIDKALAEEVSGLEDGDGEGALRALRRADERAKAVLSGVFGEENDFNRILEGVNIMAVGANGKRVIVNLFDALSPIFADGAKRCASAKLEAAKAARGNRRSPEKE